MALTTIFKYVLHATCTSELKTDEAVNYCEFLVTKVLKNLKTVNVTEHFSVYSQRVRKLKPGELNGYSAADFKPQDPASPHHVPNREQPVSNKNAHFSEDQAEAPYTGFLTEQEKWGQRA